MLNKDYSFEETTAIAFENWKKSILKLFDRWYTENRLANFKFSVEKKKLIEALHSDLNELFDRIEKHKLPYVELYDELFSWYTHNRTQMAKQILICNDKYNAYCPSMSTQIMPDGN